MVTMIEAILKEKVEKEDEGKCKSCRHCRAAVTWWCTREEAIKDRMTKIPDAKNCKFWEKMRTKGQLKLREKIFGNFIYL